MSDWSDVADENDPEYRNEIPATSVGWWQLERMSPAVPETELQALMETAPGAVPRESLEERQRQADHAMALLDELDDVERAVIECTIIGGHTIRTTAELLGLPKSTVFRIKVSAMERLRRLADQNETGR